MLLSLVIYLRQSRRLDLWTAQSGLASLCWHLLLEYLQLFEPLSAGLNPGWSALVPVSPTRKYFSCDTSGWIPHDICIPILCALDSLCSVSLSLLLVEPERFTIWRLSFDSRKCQTLRVPSRAGVLLSINHKTRSAPSFICSACAVDLSNRNRKSASPCSQAILMADFILSARTMNFDGLWSSWVRKLTM